MNQGIVESVFPEALRNHKMETITYGRKRSSAVLIPLLQKEDGWHILFEVRSASIRQGGEICFPGGRIECEEHAEEAAVRETAEELLIGEDRIRVIAPMAATEIGAGGSRIYSFLGEIRDYEGTYSASEVEKVFTMPLAQLMETEPLTYREKIKNAPGDAFPYHMIPGGKDYPWSTIDRTFYFYETPAGILWGITADILFRSLQIMKDAGFPQQR